MTKILKISSIAEKKKIKKKKYCETAIYTRIKNTLLMLHNPLSYLSNIRNMHTLVPTPIVDDIAYPRLLFRVLAAHAILLKLELRVRSERHSVVICSPQAGPAGGS